MALHWETWETYKHDDVGKGRKNIFSPQQTEISDREATVDINLLDIVIHIIMIIYYTSPYINII